MPFVGESGRLLETTLDYAYSQLPAKARIEPFFTNALSCLPIAKDPNKLAVGCRTCHDRLARELHAHPRKVILALGNPAAWSTTGDYSIKITQRRGETFETEFGQVLITTHPAFLLRGGGSYAKFKEDVTNAVSLGLDIKRPRYIDSEAVVLQNGSHIDWLTWELTHNPPTPGQPTPIATDLETSGFSPRQDDILCIGLGYEPNTSYIIPEELVHTKNTHALLSLNKQVVRWIWHNGKFDVGFARAQKIGKPRIDEDTMMLSYALDETKGLHDLEQMSADAIGAPNWKAMLHKYLPKKSASYRVIPKPVLHKYLGKDISATLQSWQVLRPRVQARPRLELLYTHTLLPLSDFLVTVEGNGLKVDKTQVKKNEVRLTQELKVLSAKINKISRAIFGHDINPNSPQQVAELLYDGVRLPTIKKKRSTDKRILKMLPPNATKDLIIEWRKHSKSLNTYSIGILKHIEQDGRVHQTYLIHGTVTGRLATRNPNTQNIPREPELRSQFVASDGYLLLEVDFNQAELRILACLSGDPALYEIYSDPEHPGLHHELSVHLFGPKYTHEDKMRAKMVNFGIVYGRTGKSLADEYHLSEAEGDRWVEGWFDRFPVAGKFIRRCRQAPMDGKILFTPFGRERRFGVVSKENAREIQNEAANFPHQSISSDANCHATIKAHHHLKRINLKPRPVNLIHDSNLWEVPNNLPLIRKQARIIIKYMEEEPALWGLTQVPFVGEAKLGQAWGHLKSFDPYSDDED